MIKPVTTVPGNGAGSAIDGLKDRILARVTAEAPLPLSALDARWPVTRHHVRLVVLELSRDGLVSFARSDENGMPLLCITGAGRAAAARSAR